VHLVEEFNELAVGEAGGVVGYLEGFGMASSTRTDTPVTRILAVATDIAYTSIIETFSFKSFAVHMLDAPETACSDGALRSAFGGVDCGGSAIGVKAETGGGCERAEEAGDEGWH